MKNYSDMNSREKVLCQFKKYLCEYFYTAYTETTLDAIAQGASEIDVKSHMASLGEIFFEVMHIESLQDLKYYMTKYHGWDDESFEGNFFRFMSK